MKITVYGKAHISGNSKKTGNPFNLTVIHTLMPARGVEGSAAKEIFMDYDKFPSERIALGVEYEIEFDNTGYPVDFHPAK